MKRHAARLASSWSVVLVVSLVTPKIARAEGWHLVTPPTSDAAIVNLEAPLSEWKDVGASFDSARECQQALDLRRAKPLIPREEFERRLHTPEALRSSE